MSLENNAESTESDTGTQSEAGTNESQADTSEAGINEGQAEGTATQEGGEPTSVEGLPDGITLEQLPEIYKNLQADYTKRTDADKARTESDVMRSQKFAKYGGEEQLLQAAEILNNDPSFQEYLASKQNAEYLGEDADEESVNALETVRNVSNDAALKMKNELMEKYINPIVQKNQEEHMMNVFSDMDKDPDVGSFWREYADDMKEKVNLIPKSESGNFNINDLKTVLFSALLEKGQFNKVMSKAHNDRLSQLKANSVEMPQGAVNKNAPGKFTNWEKAFEDARNA